MVAHNKKLDTLNFIECVQKYPEIFNTTHPGFKQQDDKSGAWHKIAEEFNTDRKFLLTVHYNSCFSIKFHFYCFLLTHFTLCMTLYTTLRIHLFAFFYMFIYD